MRAVFSPHSPCSPVVAFFYCYLLHTARPSPSSNPRGQPGDRGQLLATPPSHRETTIRPEVSGKSASSSSLSYTALSRTASVSGSSRDKHSDQQVPASVSGSYRDKDSDQQVPASVSGSYRDKHSDQQVPASVSGSSRDKHSDQQVPASVSGSYRDKHSDPQVPDYNQEERGSLINAMPPPLDSSHPQLGSDSESTRTKPARLTVSADDSESIRTKPARLTVSADDSESTRTKPTHLTVSADESESTRTKPTHLTVYADDSESTRTKPTHLTVSADDSESTRTKSTHLTVSADDSESTRTKPTHLTVSADDSESTRTKPTHLTVSADDSESTRTKPTHLTADDSKSTRTKPTHLTVSADDSESTRTKPTHLTADDSKSTRTKPAHLTVSADDSKSTRTKPTHLTVSADDSESTRTKPTHLTADDSKSTRTKPTHLTVSADDSESTRTKPTHLTADDSKSTRTKPAHLTVSADDSESTRTKPTHLTADDSKSTRTKPAHLTVSADDSHEHDPPPNTVSFSTSDQQRRVSPISADKVHPTDLSTPAADTDSRDLQSRALSSPAGAGSAGAGSTGAGAGSAGAGSTGAGAGSAGAGSTGAGAGSAGARSTGAGSAGAGSAGAGSTGAGSAGAGSTGAGSAGPGTAELADMPSTSQTVPGTSLDPLTARQPRHYRRGQDDDAKMEAEERWRWAGLLRAKEKVRVSSQQQQQRAGCTHSLSSSTRTVSWVGSLGFSSSGEETWCDTDTCDTHRSTAATADRSMERQSQSRRPANDDDTPEASQSRRAFSRHTRWRRSAVVHVIRATKQLANKNTQETVGSAEYQMAGRPDMALRSRLGVKPTNKQTAGAEAVSDPNKSRGTAGRSPHEEPAHDVTQGNDDVVTSHEEPAHDVTQGNDDVVTSHEEPVPDVTQGNDDVVTSHEEPTHDVTQGNDDAVTSHQDKPSNIGPQRHEGQRTALGAGRHDGGRPALTPAQHVHPAVSDLAQRRAASRCQSGQCTHSVQPAPASPLAPRPVRWRHPSRLPSPPHSVDLLDHLENGQPPTSLRTRLHRHPRGERHHRKGRATSSATDAPTRTESFGSAVYLSGQPPTSLRTRPHRHSRGARHHRKGRATSSATDAITRTEGFGSAVYLSGQPPTSPRTRLRRHPRGVRHHRQGRATSSATDATTRIEGFGFALYLSGKEVLTLKPPAVVSPGRGLPSAQFSMEVWVKPEGGQFDPAVLLALSDTCSRHGAGGYWLLGVGTRRGLGDPGDMGALSPTDARYFFSLKTSRSPRETTLTSHRRYQPSQWTHLAATYDGGRMALYVNGALLAVSRGQSREVFPAPSAPCLALTLGGLPAPSQLLRRGSGHVRSVPVASSKFRGSVEELRLWDRALSHADVRRHVTAVMERSVKASLRQAEHGHSSDKSSLLSPTAQLPGLLSSSSVFRPTLSGLYLHDPLDSLGQWTLDETRGATRVVPSDLALPPHDLSLSVPPCGLTVCDNPQVVTAYVTHWQLRSAKQVRYRVINLMNDDGTDPTVTGERIALQHRSLNDAFRPYNISFLLHVHEVRNSTLRRRLVMFGCERHHIGDGICSPECMHTQTGRDGGDCDVDHVRCDRRKKANGRCDFECNKYYHDWDGGDCCLPGPDTHYTCYDPRSPYSAYVAVEELRELVGLPSDSHLNVFIAVCSDWTAPKMTATHLIGLATFPWEKHVYSVQGGTVIQLQTFGTAGQMDSLVHEVGHNLGLWHVHRGVSEMDCNDPCVETEASLLLGDLCSDTAPTSHNVHCRDPDPAQDQCGVTTTFTSTPFSNYMSYADDDCTDHFTPQQGARMHCYLDLAYQPWRTLHKPSPVPLPPRVVAAAKDSVTIAWVTPLGRDAHQPGSVCSLCDDHGALVQFAAFASSPAPASPSSHWSPQQATGAPDAEACVPSIRAWLPEVSDCSKKTPCRLDLVLHVPVVVHTLTLWVTWNAEGIRRIRLHYDDGTNSVIKATPAFCDLPFTVTLSGPRRLKKVQIFTRTPFTAIDAMRVVSTPQQSQCQACRPVSYRVFRRPAMAGHYFRLTQDTHFTDRDVRNGANYLYWVETLVKRSTSQPSPVLGYTHGQSFCGDGTVNRNEGEECDDGNVRAGDGCDVSCKTEESFRCKSEAGTVSLCYRHDGDGVCEDFERQSSVQDCGFYTPPLYLDQWAHLASANPRHQLPGCPARVATGPPPRDQRCGPVVDPRSAWFPCGTQTTTGNFWLELYVPRPMVVTEVIVHVASDGRTDHDPSPKRLKVEVIREDNSTVTLTPRSLTVDCRHPQLHVPVMHDLSTPFYRARGVRVSFRSHNISIAAVRLRSYRHLDPVTLASCGAAEVYNPHTGLCLAPNCTRAPCRPAHVDDGTVLCTGQAEGDVCVVTCKKGYKPEEPSMELTCRGGHWVSPRPVSCLPVDCGRPTVRGAVVACQHGTTFGHNCSFRCQLPATLHGSDNWVVCESDGLWSAPRAICLVTCPPPLHVQHVTRVKKRCRSGSLAVGSRCKMRCRKGYHVAGARRTSRRVFRVTCEGDSTWSGPHCQRVTCPKFDPVYTGLLSCTHDVTVASRCTLTCPGSNEAQLVTCNANGQWNTPLWPCPQFDHLTCPYPRDVSHLALRCSPPAVGAQCSVTCPTPDEVAVYSDSHTTITASGRRGVQGEVVHSITCTGTGKWFPPLDRVSCIEICSTEYIGDSWCDARNNRKYCQWDGGDCCESTLGSKVEPFPQSCGEDCTCKDPKAAENRGLQAPGSNARYANRGYNDPKAAENRGLQAPGSNARHAHRGYNDPKAAENRGLQAPGSKAKHTQRGYNDPQAAENRGLQAPGSNARHTQRG